MQDCKLPVFTPGRSQQPVWRTIFKTSEFVKHFTLARILSSILDHKDSKQFAVTGKLTEQALVYICTWRLKLWIRETVLYGSFLLISVRDLIWSNTRFACINYLISTYTAAWQGGLPVFNREDLSFSAWIHLPLHLSTLRRCPTGNEIGPYPLRGLGKRSPSELGSKGNNLWMI